MSVREGDCAIAHHQKNSRYVVEEGAKQKNEDWNPKENGGFAVHGESLPPTGLIEGEHAY